MSRPLFSALLVATVALAASQSACYDDELVRHVELTEGCNPLATSDACGLPFPSRFQERPDATTATGIRWNLDSSYMPKKKGTNGLDVSLYNLADGASPVTPILIHFAADIDLSNVPVEADTDRSLDDDMPIALYNLDTGRKIRFFAEMDLNRKDDFPDRYALILRPVEPMQMGSRTLVVLRDDVHKVDGSAIEPTPMFAALRDGVLTDNPDVESLRPAYESIFSFLAQQGVARERTVLAWDFQVASEDFLLGSVLSMREEALSVAASGGLPYTITEVVDSPNGDTLRIVEGDFEVPTYLTDEDEFVYDDKHHPIRRSNNRSFPFTMVIPKKAELGEPLPLVVIGHGIFGNGRDFLTGDGDGAAIQALAEQFGAVVIATDWIGLSSRDLSEIADKVAPNLDRVGIIVDKLQQSHINVLTMTKLAKGKLQEDPMVKVGDHTLIDTSRTFYWGASLGGIQGSGFFSLCDDIERAVFGVPGSAWGTMLSRSIVFTVVKFLIEFDYPDPLDLQMIQAGAQARFDHTDPANLTTLMFKHPLPDAPPNRRVVFQVAVGDSQVPNLASDILVRAAGVKQLAPFAYPVQGLDVVNSPTEASVVAQYKLPDWDNPQPPSGNMSPAEDNGVHHAMNFLPNAHLQIAELFLAGDVKQYCDGVCDPD